MSLQPTTPPADTTAPSPGAASPTPAAEAAEENKAPKPNAPIDTVREKAVSATVWPDGGVSFQRPWKNQATGESGYSNKIYPNQEEDFLKAAKQAFAEARAVQSATKRISQLQNEAPQ